MKIISFLTFGIFFLFNTFITEAKIIHYVTQNGTGDGSSWLNASGSIQSMIDLAVGDEVWVAKGTYYPTTESIARDPRSLTFILKSGVNLYGGFIGTESDITQRVLADLDSDGKIDSYEFVNTTLLSGDIDGIEDVWTKIIDKNGITCSWKVSGNENNCYHVVSTNFNSNSNSQTTIFDGFSVIGGNSNLGSNNGGGIYSATGSNEFYIKNCFVNNCTASNDGGGIYSYNLNSSSYVSNCLVSNCSASNNGGGIFSSAMYFSISAVVLNCEVINCSASNDGGGVYSYASSWSGASADVTNCFISNCSAFNNGGGICSFASGSVNYNNIEASVYSCTVSNCSASSNYGGGGGGIYSSGQFPIKNYSPSIYLRDCAVSNCSSGGISFHPNTNSSKNINNCAVSNNGTYDLQGGTPKNIINPDISVAYIKPTSFIGIAITKAQEDELRIADWHLREGSPCINAGFFPGLYGQSDIGAFAFTIPSISLPVVEDFNNWTDFSKSLVIYGSQKVNTSNDIKWTIEDQKAVFSWETNLTSAYSESFFTYQIDATNASKVFLKYDMYFEAYSGSISPLGTEKLTVEYSTDLISWNSITSYSNQNGTIPNKTYTQDISSLVAGKSFFLRFNANGVNSTRIEKWEIDNIIVDTDGKTTDVKQMKEVPFLCTVNDGILNIQNLSDAVKVQLFDVNGKLLEDRKTANSSIQFNLPAHGVYIVRIQYATNSESKKVVW